MRETGCAANSVSKRTSISRARAAPLNNRSPCWPSGHVPDRLSRNQRILCCLPDTTHQDL